jgi:hypothetical protein
MLFREIVAVYSENHTKPKNTSDKCRVIEQVVRLYVVTTVLQAVNRTQGVQKLLCNIKTLIYS